MAAARGAVVESTTESNRASPAADSAQTAAAGSVALSRIRATAGAWAWFCGAVAGHCSARSSPPKRADNGGISPGFRGFRSGHPSPFRGRESTSLLQITPLFFSRLRADMNL